MHRQQHATEVHYQVSISLMNGDHLRGNITSFSSEDEEVKLMPTEYDASYPKVQMTPQISVLHVNHIAHIAFLKQQNYPIPLNAPQEVKDVRLELVHGESFYVKTTQGLHRERGFYSFPSDESSNIGCFFIYHHAVSAKKSGILHQYTKVVDTFCHLPKLPV